MTGVATIDQEHEELLAILAKLREVVESGARDGVSPTLLARFQAAVVKHFETEEGEMRLGYPMMSSHVSQHGKFLEEVEQTRIGWLDGEPKMAVHIKYIEEWFRWHIVAADKPLAEWIIKSGR